MLKGVVAAILGALVVTGITIGIIYLLFSGLLIWLGEIFLAGIIVGVIIMFIIVFIIVFIAFFALFYYLAEKKPTITPGKYEIEQEKGKNE